MDLQITNKQARILGTCLGHKLLPGKNTLEDLDEKQIATIMQDDQFRGWQKLGWVAVRQPTAPGLAPEAAEPKGEEVAPGDMLMAVNLEQARLMIAACSDPELLLAWHEADDRKGAKKAIEDRVAELEADQEEPAVDPPISIPGTDVIHGDAGDDPQE